MENREITDDFERIIKKIGTAHNHEDAALFCEKLCQQRIDNAVKSLQNQINIELPSDEALRCEYSVLREKHGMNEAIPLFSEWLLSKISIESLYEKLICKCPEDKRQHIEMVYPLHHICNYCRKIILRNDR